MVSALRADQSLEVLAFGKIQRDRVVRRRAKTLDDARIHLCIQRRSCDDLLEQVDRYTA